MFISACCPGSVGAGRPVPDNHRDVDFRAKQKLAPSLECEEQKPGDRF